MKMLKVFILIMLQMTAIAGCTQRAKLDENADKKEDAKKEKGSPMNTSSDENKNLGSILREASSKYDKEDRANDVKQWLSLTRNAVKLDLKGEIESVEARIEEIEENASKRVYRKDNTGRIFCEVKEALVVKISLPIAFRGEQRRIVYRRDRNILKYPWKEKGRSLKFRITKDWLNDAKYGSNNTFRPLPSPDSPDEIIFYQASDKIF